MAFIAFAILIAGFMIADAIMFVNGYRGYFFGARTDQVKAVRKSMFAVKGVEWDGK